MIGNRQNSGFIWSANPNRLHKSSYCVGVAEAKGQVNSPPPKGKTLPWMVSDKHDGRHGIVSEGMLYGSGSA
jgi:hypothetical protein